MASSFVNIEVIKDTITGEVIKFNIENTEFAAVSETEKSQINNTVEKVDQITTDVSTIQNALNITSAEGIIQVKTTAAWQADPSFIAPKGAILVYSDHKSITVDDKQVPIAGIKISDGLAYVVDLPFITTYLEKQLANHIADNIRHITANERSFWNNKLNMELSGETLTFNRN